MNRTQASERIQRLLRSSAPTGREKTWYPNGADERALLFYRHFTQSESESLPVRYAKGLAYVMENIAIAIHPGEWIVGEVGLEAVQTTHPEEFAEAQAFWQQHNETFHRTFAWYSDEMLASEHGLSSKWASRDGHAIPAFDLILQQGLGGLRQVALEAMEKYPPGDAQTHARIDYTHSMVVALDALSAYILRYAVLARDLAPTEPDLSRQAELLKIADACTWLSTHPPRDFYEALQLAWFVHLGIKLDDGSVGHSFGRFDQYLYPYFQSDLAAGILNDERALELLACFWIKLNRESDDIAHLSLGGQNPQAGDAANPLSLLCLQVERWVNRKQPNLSTRVHAATTDAYWRAIAETIRCGAGHPAIFNDEIIVPGLLDYGLSRSVVFDYAQVGCVETFLPGSASPWTDCYLNLAKCLELALNDGCDLRTGVRLGPATGDAEVFRRFEDVVAAYERQVETAAKQMLAAKDEYDTRISDHAPAPLNSAFIRDCLQRGQDATAGGARYLLTGMYGVGLGTTVDSLAAIQHVVFETQQARLSSLVTALRANFSGHEPLRSLCKKRAPQYGNDDDRADQIAVWAIESFGRLVKAYSDASWQRHREQSPHPERRAYHFAMFGSVVHHTGMGALTAASANGRLAGETLSDGGSPSQGCNRRGATATLRSLSKADYRLAPGGAAINLRLTPAHYAGDEGLDLLVSLLKSYFALGGEQLQVNMVTGDTLRKALQYPEQYRDLVVRVAGFTAYFVSLSPALQQEIIDRSEA